MKKWLRRAALSALAACVLAASAVGFLALRLPDTFYVTEGKSFCLAQTPWLTMLESTGTQRVDVSAADKSQNVTLALWGRLPVRTVRVVTVPADSVMVSGAPFGIKMFSDGALIVGFSDLFYEGSYCNPAQEAGLKKGDLVVSIHGQRVTNNDEVAAAIRAAAGQPVEVTYQRDGTRHTTTLVPRPDISGSYKAGMWVRDSSAGIGTMTFYKPDAGTFAGLGHAISDVDTGETITLLSGEIQSVTITGCTKGLAGDPGELKGQFVGGQELGTILSNQQEGVYGILEGQLDGTWYEVARMQEVTTGPAEILTTIEGVHPKRYQVQIEYLSLTAGSPNRNMILRVTDPELLQATGGIIQGMSGSPILQNGKLVGAVTHVLVNDPTRGYGIFAQTMLEQIAALDADAPD